MKLSVALQTYNHEHVISQAIDRVLRQRVSFDYEIVVGEDCSTDRTLHVVRRHQKQHPNRIKIVAAPTNRGDMGRSTMFRLLRACSGQYVATLDGDDYWTDEHKLAKQVRFLDANPNCSACCHAVERLYEDGSRALYQPASRSGVYSLHQLWQRDGLRRITTSVMMYRNDWGGEFPDWLLSGEPDIEPRSLLKANGDDSLTLFAATRGDIGYLDEVMGVKRAFADGVASTLGPIGRLKANVARLHLLDAALQRQGHGGRTSALNRTYLQLANAYSQSRDRKNAVACMRDALRLRPTCALDLQTWIVGLNICSPGVIRTMGSFKRQVLRQTA